MTEEERTPCRNQADLNEAAKYLLDSLEENMTLLANEADDPQRLPISRFWLEYGVEELRGITGLAKFPSQLQQLWFQIKAWFHARLRGKAL